MADWPLEALAVCKIREKPQLVADTLAQHLTQAQLNAFFNLLVPEPTNKEKCVALEHALHYALCAGYRTDDEVIVEIQAALAGLECPAGGES